MIGPFTNPLISSVATLRTGSLLRITTVRKTGPCSCEVSMLASIRPVWPGAMVFSNEAWKQSHFESTSCTRRGEPPWLRTTKA